MAVSRFCLLLALVSVAHGAVAGEALLPAAADTAKGYVYIARHGEKSVWYGCLNATGEARAAALPSIFDGQARANGATLYKPKALFAYYYDDGQDCERCIATLQPMAKDLGLSIQHTPSSSSTTEGVRLAAASITKALASDPVVLVAWNHHHIAALAEQLGVSAASIPTWDGSDFDSVFQLIFEGSTLVSFSVTSEGFDPATTSPSR